MRMRLAIGALCALAFSFALTIDGNSVVDAVTTGPCDFLTGGGYIQPQPMMGNKANFAVAGGCKQGAFWGHLQYQDKVKSVKVHSLTITGYQKAVEENARLICGRAKSENGDDVDFLVRAKDAGEPGNNDEFDVHITKTMGGDLVYTTFGSGPVYHQVIGGNVQLHKPNPSNTGDFGTCPPVPGGGGGGGGPFTLDVALSSIPSGVDFPGGTVTSNAGGINCVLAPGAGNIQSGTCSASFALATPPVVVTLTAAPDPNDSASAILTGCDPGTETPPSGSGTRSCQVTMNAPRVVSIQFTFAE